MRNNGIDAASVATELKALQKDLRSSEQPSIEELSIHLMEYLENREGDVELEQKYGKNFAQLAMQYCVELIRILYYGDEDNYFNIKLPAQSDKNKEKTRERLDLIQAGWGLTMGHQRENGVTLGETREVLYKNYQVINSKAVNLPSAQNTCAIKERNGFEFMAERLSLILNAKPDHALHLLDLLLATGEFDKDKNYTFVYPKPYYEALLPKENTAPTTEVESSPSATPTPSDEVPSEAPVEKTKVRSLLTFTKDQTALIAVGLAICLALLWALVASLSQANPGNDNAEVEIAEDVLPEQQEDLILAEKDPTSFYNQFCDKIRSDPLYGDMVAQAFCEIPYFRVYSGHVITGIVDTTNASFEGASYQHPYGMECWYDDYGSESPTVSRYYKNKASAIISWLNCMKVGEIQNLKSIAKWYITNTGLIANTRAIQGIATGEEEMLVLSYRPPEIIMPIMIGISTEDFAVSILSYGDNFEPLKSIYTSELDWSQTDSRTEQDGIYLDTLFRIEGVTGWSDCLPVKEGQLLQCQITYINMSESQQKAFLSVSLPGSVAFVDDVLLYNSNYRDGLSYRSSVFKNSVNIGGYEPNGNAYLRFSCLARDNGVESPVTAVTIVNASHADSNVTVQDIGVIEIELQS